MSDRPLMNPWSEPEKAAHLSAPPTARTTAPPPPAVVPVTVVNLRVPFDQVFVLVFKVVMALVLLAILPVVFLIIFAGTMTAIFG